MVGMMLGMIVIWFFVGIFIAGIAVWAIIINAAVDIHKGDKKFRAEMKAIQDRAAAQKSSGGNEDDV